jgi:hypothetical protein
MWKIKKILSNDDNNKEKDTDFEADAEVDDINKEEPAVTRT